MVLQAIDQIQRNHFKKKWKQAMVNLFAQVPETQFWEMNLL